MYVYMPGSWFSHPFLKNEFIIQSREQLDKIVGRNYREIDVDPDRGVAIDETDALPHGTDARTPPKTWDPATLVPPELRAAVNDRALSPEKKSKVVYESSLVLMDRLFEDPKAENIKAAKAGIFDIVNLIIADDATSKNLLHITSYDFYTYTHSVNVGVLSVLLAKELFRHSDGHDMQELGAGFFLHDIGKVQVRPEVLNKAGRLTDAEMAHMRIHPYQGYRLLETAGQLTDECRHIVMEHHERRDGTGYPRRLRGDEIHPYGKICCIADVYDALTAERSYKLRLSTFQALTVMKEELLGHFEGGLFERFVRLFAP